MLRSEPTPSRMCGTRLHAGGLLALSVLSASCIPVGSDPAAEARDDAPLVGRLQFQDRILDLTVNAFAGDAPVVPRNAVAEIMADVAATKPSEEQAPEGAPLAERASRFRAR